MASKKKKVSKLPGIFIRIGIGLVALGLTILFFTFIPIIFQEVRYQVRQPQEIEPIDRDFGIVIPKLGANAHVIANVDPYNARAYQVALTKGVAHARGTSVPGATGNMFLFAHSSEDFYNAVRYNSIFYLLTKLEAGDEIILYYKEVKFTYVVKEKKFVDPKDVSYLELGSGESTLTLMTCWPPGTTIKRLLVFASLSKN